VDELRSVEVEWLSTSLTMDLNPSKVSKKAYNNK
jgi:hypothetical protein